MDANDIPRVGLRVREATIADADALSELEILARPGDPSWTYRYTYREEFPEDHQRFNRAKYDGILNALSPFRIMIAEDAGKPVALSIWDLSRVRQGEVYSTSSRPRPASNERRDQNPQRVKAFVETHDRARPFFFDNGFAPGGYIYCTILATHPDHQGCGAATLLVRWGMEYARQNEVKLTIMSSQLDPSRRLYDGRLGFLSLGAVVVRAEGEKESMRMEVLGYDPKL